MRFRNSRLILTSLLAVAFVPASLLVYLQYRSLNQLEQQTHQAMIANMRQALTGARIEIETDFHRWPDQVMLGPKIHTFMQNRDLDRIRSVAESARRVCPEISMFFGYRSPPGQKKEIFVYRPGPAPWSMDYRPGDPAEGDLEALVAGLHETWHHMYTWYGVLHGAKQQVFLHLVDDDDPPAPGHGHRGKIGYFGFSVPATRLAREYIRPILEKHLAQLAWADDQTIGHLALGAVFDGDGKPLSTSQTDVSREFVLKESIGHMPTLLPGWAMRADLAAGTSKSLDRAHFARGIWITLTVAALLMIALVSIGMTTLRELELSHVKTEFLASVSHDLKTPLSLIRGFVETLHLNRLRDPAQRDEYFRIINDEIQRLSAMINRILECSKIEAGLKRYRPETVDIRDLIEDTLEYFSPELDRQCFTLERRLETSLPSASVDPEAFSDALLNLLDNAVKYAGDRRHITVAAARTGRRLEVSVSDDGPGVALADQSRIFNRFYRGKETTKAASGAGLGLALVKHFATAHGGEVAVSSSPGHGSRFSIFLPLSA